MREKDRISSIVLLIIGVILSLASMKIGLGTIHAPGSGFWPFFAGVFLSLSTLPTLIRASLEKKSKEASLQELINFWKVVKVIIAFFAYTLLLSKLGYVIGTFLLMLFFLRGVETMSWKWTLIMTILTVLSSYVIFDVWLQCMFPVGLVDLRGLVRWIF